MTEGGRSVVSAVVAAAASLCLLAGCGTTAALPAGPTDAEREAAIGAELDRQWDLTGLEGIHPRPLVVDGDLVSADVWNTSLGSCLDSLGLHGFFYEEERGLVRTDGGRADPEQMLQWYQCLAKYPSVVVLTAGQLEYIHHYYTSWLVPCLGFRGHPVGEVPAAADLMTRAGFTMHVWNPYLEFTFVGGEEEYWDALAACPPTTPGIDGWSESFG
jgi:hypothetical protein